MCQLIDTAYTGAITDWKSESAVLFVGGIWAGVAALVTLFFLDLSDESTGMNKSQMAPVSDGGYSSAKRPKSVSSTRSAGSRADA